MKYCTNCACQVTYLSKFCKDCGQSLNIEIPNEHTKSNFISENNQTLMKTTSEEKRSMFSSPIFYEKNLKKLLDIYVSYSIVDIVFSLFVNLMGYIPTTEPKSDRALSEFLFEVIWIVIGYSLLKYWGILKQSIIPFIICLTLNIAMIVIMFNNESHLEEFSLFLDERTSKPYLNFMIFYSHFLSCFFIQSFIIIRMLFSINKVKIDN
jgi:hypothetical protein